tara:strand:+ start:911 stop:1567 length:657 start_codon:yes stop_codon:yes gene_type:complete
MKCEKIGNAVLYNCKIEEILNKIPFVDALVTDPPYGINESNKQNLSRENKAKPKDYGCFDWDKEKINQDTINSLILNSKYQIIFGGNYYVLPPTPCWLVWDKQNTGDFADCELAWTNLKMAVRRIYWRWNGMIRRGKDVRVHPTQKPVGVMTWCIEKLPKETQTIFDPFMGSGTTGVAAHKMNKGFIGVEPNEQYFEKACERITEAQRQDDLFYAVGQ